MLQGEAPPQVDEGPRGPSASPEGAWNSQQQGEAPPQVDEAPTGPSALPPKNWNSFVHPPAPPSSVAESRGESALPPDLWRGLDAGAMQSLLAQVPLPSSSPALASLLARALATSPEGSGRETEVKIAALERAGRVNELIEMLGEANEPEALAAYALALLAAGRNDEACAVQLGTGQPDGAAKRASFLIPAYCAAASGDNEAARNALDVARNNGVDVGFALRVIAGQGGRGPLTKSVDVLDYLFLKLGQSASRADIAPKASPELLFLLARDDEASPELRVAAAERAASLNIIDGTTLATVYRDAAPRLPKSAQSPAALRAKLFASLEAQTSEKIRAESIDALLASGKDARIEIPMAQAMAQSSQGRDTQAASFAETDVRVAALAGDDQTAWDLTEQAGDRVRSWQLLLVTTDPLSERARSALDGGVDIALKAGLPGPLLQRLVTALDALGEEVPIPLWDLAAKTPQPDDGYLPPTGLLSTLKEAADAGDTGRTILLAAAVFGPDGPQGAHLIALGDGLRALKRVGLDAEARRLAFEALCAHWPSRGKA
ncbi:MAG: hypothetical protein WCD39_01325 [Methyloceanibacter sp.]